MSRKPYPTAPTAPMGYPQQNQGPYPTAYPQAQYPATYPYHQPAYGAPGMPGAPQAPPQYSEAPPPYTQYPSQLPPGPPPAVMYPQQQPTTVVAPGLFDAGARFDGMSQHRIPPPPPGVAPNQAQMAAMQGHTVVGTQQGSNWMTGGGRDGGYSWGF